MCIHACMRVYMYAFMHAHIWRSEEHLLESVPPAVWVPGIKFRSPDLASLHAGPFSPKDNF